MNRFDEQQAKLVFFNSLDFKRREKQRMERSKPTEHTAVDFARVYCPEYDKVRPQWLCEQEHGDVHEVLDEEEVL